MEIGEIFDIFPSGTKSMGARGSKKAYTRARTGMYLHTKFGWDRSIVAGCRTSDDRQTNKQTSGNDNKAHSLRDVTQQTDKSYGHDASRRRSGKIDCPVRMSTVGA